MNMSRYGDCAVHKTDLYMYLKSSDSLEYYPTTNTFNFFHCLMPQTIQLTPCQNHKWSVAITDLCLVNASTGYSFAFPQSAVILCSIVEPSIIKSAYRPILRQFWSSEEGQSISLNDIIYRAVTKNTFNSLSFELLDHNLKPLELEKWKGTMIKEGERLETSMVLHFQLTMSPV